MEPAKVKIQGFAPDMDITSPGIITGGTAFIPTINGISPPMSLVSAGYAALAATCTGTTVVRLLDDSRRLFAGTQTKLYEGSGTSWTDQSGASTFTGGIDNRWRFAQFGNDTIATNYTDAMQVSTSSGAFSALGGTPPKAAIIETCQGFVMAFDYNDGVNVYHDGWWCSALRNDASWSPSIATQAENGRLLDTPGSIRAARAMGDVMVAYKERSMYLGFNDGPPVIWRWQLVPGDIGAVSQEAVVNVLINNAPAQIFAGFDGFYVFDGTRPISIGDPLKNWYNRTASAQYRYRIRTMHDRTNQTVYFYLPDSSGNLTFCVPYNYRRNTWGYLASIDPIQAALEYLSEGITYNTLGSFYSTYDSLPAISYDSPFWTSGAPVPSVFGSNSTLQSYTGTPAASGFYCGYTGDENMFNTLVRVRPRFNSYPTGAVSCNVLYTQNIGDQSPSTIATSNLNNGKMDVMKSSKWFAPQISVASGNYELTGYDLLFEGDGEE